MLFSECCEANDSHLCTYSVIRKARFPPLSRVRFSFFYERGVKVPFPTYSRDFNGMTKATSTKRSPQNRTLQYRKSFAIIPCCSRFAIWTKYPS